MTFSSVGRKKVAGHVSFLLVNIIVLVLSTRVNQYQDFFFVADMLPFALSIISLIVITVLLLLDLALDNSYTGRSQIEIGIFGILSIFWLAFSAFSTSRWYQIPFHCDSIPLDFSDERLWCKSLQALKSFVWINFIICFAIAVFTLRYTVGQYIRGNKHIFQMPLSRYRPELKGLEPSRFPGTRDSEFLQFEKLA